MTTLTTATPPARPRLSRQGFLATAVAGALAVLPGPAALARAGAGSAAARAGGPLDEVVLAAMARRGVPGVAVGVVHGAEEHVAGYGVTNAEHPLPVDGDTLFQVGSVAKAFTATAVLRLVEQGRVALEAPVRAYLPDFRVADPDASARATVRDLLAHTAGWVGDVFAEEDLSQNDDALERAVAGMARLPQVAPVGAHFGYNNAGYLLAGRVVEVAAGRPFEAALQHLVLEPLGLRHTFTAPHDAVTHRLAVGHAPGPAGPAVLRDWAQPRFVAPMGQVIASAGDLLRFARAHLGAQATPAAGAQGGAPLLAPETLARMQAPLGPGGTLAGKDLDGIGAAWELRTVGGVRVAQKGGRLPGSEALLLLVPERAFALTVQTNAVGGYALADEVAGWALGHYLGLAEPPITPAPLPADRLRPYAGRYVSPGERAFEVTAADGGLLLQRVPLGEPGQPGEPGPGRPAPPARLAFYGPDRVVGLEGAEQHARHDFVRRPDGGLGWLRYGGRLCARQGRAD